MNCARLVERATRRRRVIPVPPGGHYALDVVVQGGTELLDIGGKQEMGIDHKKTWKELKDAKSSFECPNQSALTPN